MIALSIFLATAAASVPQTAPRRASGPGRIAIQRAAHQSPTLRHQSFARIRSEGLASSGTGRAAVEIRFAMAFAQPHRFKVPSRRHCTLSCFPWACCDAARRRRLPSFLDQRRPFAPAYAQDFELQPVKRSSSRKKKAQREGFRAIIPHGDEIFNLRRRDRHAAHSLSLGVCSSRSA